MRTDATATRVTDVLARLAEVRRMRAMQSERHARDVVRRGEAHREAIAETHRRSEAALLQPGEPTPAAFVQLVGDARGATRTTLGQLDRALADGHREVARRHEATVEVAKKRMGASRLAEYVRAARRTDLADQAQQELEETARLHRVVDSGLGDSPRR